MDEMSLESLHVSYGVPNSISLEKAKDNKWPSGPLPEAVTAHLDFFTCGVRFPFHFFSRYMLLPDSTHPFKAL